MSQILPSAEETKHYIIIKRTQEIESALQWHHDLWLAFKTRGKVSSTAAQQEVMSKDPSFVFERKRSLCMDELITDGVSIVQIMKESEDPRKERKWSWQS